MTSLVNAAIECIAKLTNELLAAGIDLKDIEAKVQVEIARINARQQLDEENERARFENR